MSGDASKLFLAAAGVLARHEADPRGELSPGLKLLPVAHGSDDGGSNAASLPDLFPHVSVRNTRRYSLLTMGCQMGLTYWSIT